MSARLRALRRARGCLERHCLRSGWDRALSRIIDALVIEEETMSPLQADPRDFDFPARCVYCDEPTPVPTSWVLRPPGPGEPDPPQRVVLHETCRDTLARIPEAAEAA